MAFRSKIYSLLETIHPALAGMSILITFIVFYWMYFSFALKVRQIIQDHFKIYLSFTRLIIFGDLYLQYKINRLPVQTSRKRK